MTGLENYKAEKRRRASLTWKASLYGSLAIGALLISALNVLALIGTFWEPTHLLLLPLYMMLAVVSLWAGVSFLQTRSKLLSSRDAPRELEDD